EEVLALESAVRAVQAGASLRFQVHAVNRLRVGLAWYRPSAVVVPAKPASRGDYQPSFFAWRHQSPPHCLVILGAYYSIYYDRLTSQEQSIYLSRDLK